MVGPGASKQHSSQAPGHDPARRQNAEFLDLLARAVRWCDVTSRTGDCADPKDNKFLELACDASAMLIVTGDDDLLRLHPWRGVRIVAPATFLAEDSIGD